MKIFSIEFDEHDKMAIQEILSAHTRETIRLRDLFSSAEPVSHPTRSVSKDAPANVPVNVDRPAPAEVCSICRKEPHAKWCGKPTPPPAPVPTPEPEPAIEKEPEEEKGAPKPSKGKECCGSKAAWRHKVNCPTLKADGSLPADEPVDEIDADATKSEADEKPEPKDAPEQDEEQAFACRECGNSRMEPYGTNALALFCPNELGDDGDKHVYELKED